MIENESRSDAAGTEGGTAEEKRNARPAPSRTAEERAVRLLEGRPHFRRELEQKLARAGHDGAEIAAALDRLAAAGYLDDAAQTRAFAATLAGRRGFGASRVRRELARRGAPEAAIAAALAASGPDDELERAREVAAKRARRGVPDAPAIARHLDRRGFDRRVIFTVLKELAAATGDSEGEPFDPDGSD